MGCLLEDFIVHLWLEPVASSSWNALVEKSSKVAARRNLYWRFQLQHVSEKNRRARLNEPTG
jgi:hypothetical protein